MKRLLTALIAALLLATFAGTAATAAPARARGIVLTTTQEAYGPDPRQSVTVIRDHTRTTPQPLVIFWHGGSWDHGDRGDLATEATLWARAGYVVANAEYRVGTLDGTPDDGRAILADALTVLAKYRARSYVDPARVIVYGESAGAHIAAYVGAYKGAQVAAIIGISPVISTGAAITAGQAEGAPPNVAGLGRRAAEFFGYSTGTTSAPRYSNRVQKAYLVWAIGDWVDPLVHAAPFCATLGDRCTRTRYPGDLHGGALVEANPDLRDRALDWATANV